MATTRKPVPALDTAARPTVAGGPLSQSATTLELDVDQLVRHSGNVRFDIALDDEMLASIEERGILQPLLVAPTPDATTYTVIDGNRRHLHVEELANRGIKVKVPVHCRYDLTTAQRQREAMLITGLQRLNLTAAEESKAYEDAVLEGLDVTAIAKATGRKAATIKGRLKLSVLSDEAKTSLHTGQLTIGDAEAIASFSDDPDATKALEAELGTPGFAQTLRVLEMHRKVARETETKVKAAEKAGLPKVEHDSPSWSYGTGPYPISYLGRAEQDLAVHIDAGCAAWCLHYERFYEVCTNPASHREDDPEVDEVGKALQQSEWEKQQEAREEQRVAGIAAMQLRLELLRDNLAATVTAQSLGKTAIGMLRLTLPTTIEGDAPVEGFMHLMGIESAKPYGWQDDWLETHWPSATDAFVIQVWVAILAAQLDDVLLDDRTDNPDLRLAAWDWYSAMSGAAFSDVDTALYAEAEAALDADDHSAKAS